MKVLIEPKKFWTKLLLLMGKHSTRSTNQLKYSDLWFFSHNDLAMNLRYLLKNDLSDFNFNSNLSTNEIWNSIPYNHIDLPRMREGRLQGQVRTSVKL